MELTPTQQRAVQTIDRPLGIIAGAGAGKTRVLVERCLHLLRTTDLQLHQLLAITFTDRAAQELRARLAAQLPSEAQDALHGAAITTFHGLAMRMLQAHAPLMGLSPHFRLLDAAEASLLCQRAVTHTLHQRLEQRDAPLRQLLTLYNFRQIADGMEMLLNDRWNVAQWQREQDSIDTAWDIPSPTAQESAALTAALALLDACSSEFTAIKRRQQTLDFQDLEELALQLLREHPEILADYQQQFRHILVDEFQDTNVIQMELITLLFTPPDNVLCIVGDPKQSIYRFRGAQRDCFQQMLTAIVQMDGEVITLTENFRSLPAVIDFVHAACPDIPADQQMIATRTAPVGHGQPVTILPIADSDTPRRDDEAVQVVARIRTLVDAGHTRYGDIACLFPTRKAVQAYTTMLRAHDIPVHVYSGSGLLSRRAILDLLYALDVLAALQRQQPDDTRLLALLRAPLFGLTDDDCYRLVHLSDDGANERESASTWPPLHQAVRTVPALWTHLRTWLELAPTLQAPALLRQIVHDTAYLDVLTALDPSGAQTAGVEQFLQWCDELPIDPDATLPEFVARIRHMQASTARMHEAPIMPAGDDAVQCMTIHAAKGNEFPVVIVADLAGQRPSRMDAWYFSAEFGLALRELEPERSPTHKDAQSPRWQKCRELEKKAAAAECDRLLYVALTRAADALIIPVPVAEKSPWLERVRGACHGLGISFEPDSEIHESPQGTFPKQEHARPHAVACKPQRLSLQPTVRETSPLTMPPRAFPTHITVSALEAYDRCPQEYYLKYIAGVPADTLTWPDPHVVPAHVRGDVVHAALQQASSADVSPHTAARAELARRGWNPALAEHAPLAALLETGATFLQHLPAERRVEYPFRLRLAVDLPTLITGTIDCLARTDTGWELIDYKTDRIDDITPLHHTAKLYSLQMTLYAIAAVHAGFQPLRATTLVFLDVNEQVSQPVTEERLATGKAHVRNILTHIATHNFTLPTHAHPPCARCAYHHNQMCGFDRLRQPTDMTPNFRRGAE